MALPALKKLLQPDPAEYPCESPRCLCPATWRARWTKTYRPRDALLCCLHASEVWDTTTGYVTLWRIRQEEGLTNGAEPLAVAA